MSRGFLKILFFFYFQSRNVSIIAAAKWRNCILVQAPRSDDFLDDDDVGGGGTDLNLSNFLFMRNYDWISIWSTTLPKSHHLNWNTNQFLSHFFLSLCLRYLGSKKGGVVKVKASIVLDATNVTVSQQFCENHWSWPNIHEEPPWKKTPFTAQLKKTEYDGKPSGELRETAV